MTARLCLNMIVKNESAIIERCLAAAAPHIDCYVICDTGSTDDTIEKIETFFAANGVAGLIAQTTFHDFGQALPATSTPSNRFRTAPNRCTRWRCTTSDRQSTSWHLIADAGSKIPQPDGALFVESEVYAWRLIDIVAVSLYWMGRHAEAAVLNRRLLDIVPESARARITVNLEYCENPP